MLNDLKLLLGINDNSKDSLLILLINNAKNEIINYTHNDKCLDELESTIIEMVVFRYNRLKTEGVDSENYSGVVFNYSADYPEAILRPLKAFRKAVFK